MGFWDNLGTVMNGAGNIIPPSVDGNIHPEASARNLGTDFWHPPLYYKDLAGAAASTSSGKSLLNSKSRSSVPSFRELTADSPSQPQIFDYLDAPWASSYGMSKETAYAEAMENTAYRRAVSDMQKAGLNPAVIFGAGRGSTAGSPSYISSGSSGSSGRVSRRGSGGRSSGKLFSTSAYSVLSALGGIVGAAATKSAGGYWLGMSLSQGAMSALNLLSKR